MTAKDGTSLTPARLSAESSASCSPSNRRNRSRWSGPPSTRDDAQGSPRKSASRGAGRQRAGAQGAEEDARAGRAVAGVAGTFINPRNATTHVRLRTEGVDLLQQYTGVESKRARRSAAHAASQRPPTRPVRTPLAQPPSPCPCPLPCVCACACVRVLQARALPRRLRPPLESWTSTSSPRPQGVLDHQPLRAGDAYRRLGCSGVSTRLMETAPVLASGRTDESGGGQDPTTDKSRE